METPNDPKPLSLPPPDPYDATGSKNIGSNQGAFKDLEFMKVFDNYKLYKNGMLVSKKGRVMTGDKYGSYKINGKKVQKKYIMDKYKDFITA